MRIAKIAVIIIALSACVFAQDKSKRPSQPGQASVTLNGKKITVDYSRPKIADPKTGEVRKIFGGAPVPFNQVWRLGANEATTLKTPIDLDINGKTLPAGEYTLFAYVEPEKWTLIVSKATGEWGIPYPGQDKDFARIPMKVEQVKDVVDPFTISFDQSAPDQATMISAWEHTKASVVIKAK